MKKVKPNKYIENLSSYKITSQDPWIIDNKKIINKLDWNEGDFVPKIISDELVSLSKKEYLYKWYSDYSAHDLHQVLGNYLNVTSNNLLSFPGSDNALECICRCYLEYDDKVIMLKPTYDNFEVFAASCGAKLINYQLEKPYNLNFANFIKFIEKNDPKVIYLVSPNNPCGYIIDPEQVSIICQKFPETLVICDQAYIEFAQYADCKHLVEKFNNIIITRTFSKAFSLAGIRLGYVISNHNILKIISKIRNGKNISMISQIIGIKILKNFDKYTKWINSVIHLRDMIYNDLIKLGLVAYKSHGNFILFEINSSQLFLAELKRKNVYIRDKILSTDGGIRITITNKKSMNIFMKILNEYISNKENQFYF